MHVFRLNGGGRHARDSVHAVYSWQMSVSVQPCTAIRPMMSAGKGRASRKAHSVEEAGGISQWRGEQRFCLHLRSAVLAAADLDRAVVVQNTEREEGLSRAGFRPWILAGPQVGSLPLTCASPESVDGTRYGSIAPATGCDPATPRSRPALGRGRSPSRAGCGVRWSRLYSPRRRTSSSTR